MVYPGATHTRFLHSVGVMHLSGKFAVSILRTSEGFAGQSIRSMLREEAEYYIPHLDDLGVEDEGSLLSILTGIRLGGLMHDIGHMPFSHAFEEAVLSSSKRLANLGVRSHEDLGHRIYVNYLRDRIRRFVRDRYGRDGICEDAVCECLDYIMSPREEHYRLPAYVLARHLVKEFVYPADIVDFCMRDSYFAGTVEYGRIDADRLFMFSLAIFQSNRTLIGLMRKAVGALRAYLFSRLWLFNNVYLHKFSRLMDYVVRDLLHQVHERGIIDFEGIIEGIVRGDEDARLELEKMDDGYVLYRALESRDEELRDLSKRILCRRPHLREVFFHEITIRLEDFHMAKRGERFEDIIGVLRKEVAEALSVDIEHIIIDSPPIRIFPLNPYLPYSTFPIVETSKRTIIGIREADAWKITNTRMLDFIALRILIPSRVLRSLGMMADKVGRKMGSLITDDFEERLKAAFIRKYSGAPQHVTM